MHCPNCGLSNPDNAKFCANCGTSFTGSSSASPPPPPSQPYTPQPYRPPQSGPAQNPFTARNIALGCLLLVLLIFFMGFFSCMRGCGRHYYYKRPRVYRRY